MLTRLLSRLHRIFDKNPQRTPVVNIAVESFPATATVKDYRLTLFAAGLDTTVIPFAEMTVAQLVATIQSVPGYDATMASASHGAKLAKGILSETLDLARDPKLYYPGSASYCEFQVYAGALEGQESQRRAAERQLYAQTAQDDWLDYWMADFFTVPRIQGESDSQYLQRARAEVLTLKVNNKALMKLIMEAVDHFVDVRDMGDIPNGCLYSNSFSGLSNDTESVSTILDTGTIDVRNGWIGVYVHSGNINNLNDRDKAAIVNIITRYKAAGKRAAYFAPDELLIANDPAGMLNSRGYVAGPKSTGWTEIAI